MALNLPLVNQSAPPYQLKMAKRSYTIFCDESSKAGKHYSNFYGGCLIRSRDRQAIEASLRAKKDELNLFDELKWTKVTANYLDKYIEFIDHFFEFVDSGRIKIRIMFTHNYYRPLGLSGQQVELGYFLLYYQMLKHAFGVKYCNPNGLDRVNFNVLLDTLPVTKSKADTFKDSIASIGDLNDFRGLNISFSKENIGEIDSKEHAILQGLDIVLGSIHFRLNDLHKVKPEGAVRRGKRTIAKEKLYKQINQHIRRGYKNFNIGSSTGCAGGPKDRWDHSYRHWKFIPSKYSVDQSVVKER